MQATRPSIDFTEKQTVAGIKKEKILIWYSRLAFPLMTAAILSRTMHTPFLNMWTSIVFILIGLVGIGIHLNSGGQNSLQKQINQVTDENLKARLHSMKLFSIFLATWLILNMLAIMIFYFIKGIIDPTTYDAIIICSAAMLAAWWVSTIIARNKYDQILRDHHQMTLR